VCNCLIDEGRPLGTGWQEQGSKPPSAAVVKSHGREHRRKRPWKEPRSGDWQEEDAREPLIRVESGKGRCRNRRESLLRD